MTVNLSPEMIRVVRRTIERDLKLNVRLHGGIEEGEPETYPVDGEDALELFRELERQTETMEGQFDNDLRGY